MGGLLRNQQVNWLTFHKQFFVVRSPWYPFCEQFSYIVNMILYFYDHLYSFMLPNGCWSGPVTTRVSQLMSTIHCTFLRCFIKLQKSKRSYIQCTRFIYGWKVFLVLMANRVPGFCVPVMLPSAIYVAKPTRCHHLSIEPSVYALSRKMSDGLVLFEVYFVRQSAWNDTAPLALYQPVAALQNKQAHGGNSFRIPINELYFRNLIFEWNGIVKWNVSAWT